MGGKTPKIAAPAAVEAAPPPPQDEKESDAAIKDSVDRSRQRAAARAAASATIMTGAQGDLTVANTGKTRLGA